MKKPWLLLAGVLLAFLLLEISLRVLGIASTLEARRGSGPATPALVGTLSPPPADPAAFRILCVGNSHTQGAGTVPYPAALEALLRARHPARAFQVINAGRGNLNSAEVLELLPGLLTEYKPALVFVMIGEPNFWNYHYFERQQGAGSTLFDKLRFLKVARLADILLRFDPRREPRDEPGFGVPYPNGPWIEYPGLAMSWVSYLDFNPKARVPAVDLRVAAEALEKWITHPRGAGLRRAWSTLAEVELRLGRMDRALRAAEGAMRFGAFDLPLWQSLARHAPRGAAWRALEKELLGRLPTPAHLPRLEAFAAGGKEEIDESFLRFAVASMPGHPGLAGQLAKQKPRESESILLAAWSENPGHPGFSHLSSYLALAQPLRQRIFHESRPPLLAPQAGHAREAGESERKPTGHGLTDERINEELAQLKKWVASDLRRVVEIARDYGATPILQTYPPYRRSRRERWPDPTIRAAAAELGAPLVDVSAAFLEEFRAVESEAYFRRAGIQDDNHLNTEGNAFVARLMQAELERLKLIP